MDTYTQPGGYTPQGNATNSLADALAAIQGMSAPVNVTPQQASTAQSNAMQFAAQEPANVQQATNSLTQQAGIPQLQGQQADLGKVFELYLHDQNLSKKYQGNQLSSPNSPIFNNPNLTPNKGIYTGDTSSVPNPYLSDPTALVNAVTQPSGQGFQGFTSPGMITGAMGEVPSAATGIMKILQDAIGQEKSIVSSKTGDYTKAYESQSSLLNNLANILGNQMQSQQTLAASNAQPGSASSVKSSINSLMQDIKGKKTLKEIMAKYQQDPNLTADKIIQLYNSNSPYGPAKEDPLTLAQTYGITGGFGKTGSSKKYQAKKLPDGTMVNYDPSSGKYSDPNTGKSLQLNDATVKMHDDLQSEFTKMKNAWNQAKSLPTPANRQKYMSEKQLMSDKLYYALTKSRAYQGAQKLVANLPDPYDPIATLGGTGDAQFSGFEEQLNLGGKQAIGGQHSSGNSSRQAVVSKLKQSGYNDNQIHEYLRTKGIDK